MGTIFVISVIFIIGCASNKPYAQFAQAGIVYTDAVNLLLIAGGSIGIDATSERLLQDDKLANQTIESYRKLSNIDKERLEIIGCLRAHLRLLALYFGLLNELATSDAPQRAQLAIGGVVDGLNTLGNKLRGSNLVSNKDVFTNAAKLSVSFKIRGLLKDEFSKRKDLIRIELKTQEELLQALTNAIQHDLTITNQIQEQRLVIDPLIAITPVVNADEWIINRRKVLTSSMRASELETASDAARKLREAFETLVSDKPDFGYINTFLTDLESILAIAETINHERG